MAMLPINYSLKRNIGFTLIEVLVALAIISIAMTAIIKSASQNIRSTHYLQNKTIALYVGEQILNEIRLGILPLADITSDRKKTTMLDKDWYWQVEMLPTPNSHIQKIIIDVYSHDASDSSIVTLAGYRYAG